MSTRCYILQHQRASTMRPTGTRDRSRSGSMNRSTEAGAYDPCLPSGYRQLTLKDIFDRPPASTQVQSGQRDPTLDLVSSGITDEHRRIANVICRPITDGEAGVEFEVPALCFSEIPSAEPEICAFSWLQDGRVTFPQLRVLFHMLPAAVVKRHQAPHLTCTQDARAIHFGAWVHGGNIGVMNTWPNFSLCCSATMPRAAHPSAAWTVQHGFSWH